MQITNNAAINTTTPGTGNYGLHFTGQTTADYAAGITWNGGTGTTGAQAGIYVQGSGSYGTKMYLATTDSYATGARTAVSIDHTGAVNVVRAGLSRNSRNVPTYVAAASAPSSPMQGDFWYNSSSDTLYQYIYDGTNSQWVDISTGLTNASASATASTLALRDASADLYATVFRGKATSAQYADLAENYTADAKYEPGTVVVFGGDQEITITDKSHDNRVAGVISTDPAYLMNSECTGLPVALTGRVPCKVIGKVRKGDVLVTSDVVGAAQTMNVDKYVPGCVIGKALENKDNDELAVIEIAVGRF